MQADFTGDVSIVGMPFEEMVSMRLGWQRVAATN
jgi:hypothetical protein